MLYLVDTGILLRLFNRADPNCLLIRKALWELRKQGHRFVISSQNVAEFWNVSTRPSEARGGFGLSVEDTERRLRVVERICFVMAEHSNAYSFWRDLVVTHGVKGVQVHDARLAAWMKSHAITHVVTLNEADFARYPGIVACHPKSLIEKTPST